MKAASSRAIAVATTVGRLPFRVSDRKRPHNLICAFQAISRTALGAAATFICFSPSRPSSATATALRNFDVSIPTKARLCWSTTRPPCLRLCPANPGNPRRNIEGESPLQGRTYSLAYCGHSAALVALGISAMPKLRMPMPQTLQRRGVETTGHRRRPYPCRKRVIATLIGGPPARPTSYDFAQRENRKDRGKRPLESRAEPPAKTGIFRAVEVAGC